MFDNNGLLCTYDVTAARHSQVGHPSGPHLYPRLQLEGQEREFRHVCGRSTYTCCTVVNPTTAKNKIINSCAVNQSAWTDLRGKGDHCGRVYMDTCMLLSDK